MYALGRKPLALDRERLVRGIVERLARDLREKTQTRGAAGVVKSGWSAVDDLLPRGGLPRGVLHEWIGVRGAGPDSQKSWRPPLGLLIHLAGQAQGAGLGHGARPSPLVGPGRIAWVGPSVWPYPPALRAGGLHLLGRSLFIRARTVAERVFAAGLLLRTRTVEVVVIDGSAFDLTATRRMNLAAEAGSALCLMARPPAERERLSAAWTRWLVSASPTPGRQRWIVELLRCKGLQPTRSETAPSWSLERDHATRAIIMAGDMVDGSRLAKNPPPKANLAV